MGSREEDKEGDDEQNEEREVTGRDIGIKESLGKKKLKRRHGEKNGGEKYR